LQLDEFSEAEPLYYLLLKNRTQLGLNGSTLQPIIKGYGKVQRALQLDPSGMFDRYEWYSKKTESRNQSLGVAAVIAIAAIASIIAFAWSNANYLRDQESQRKADAHALQDAQARYAAAQSYAALTQGNYSEARIKAREADLHASQSGNETLQYNVNKYRNDL